MIGITRTLNLTIGLARPDGTIRHVHSVPLSQAAFETWYLVLARTFSALTQNGLDPRSGPSVAALMLRDVAKETPRPPDGNWWDGPDGVEKGLMAEIVRLSNVALPDGQGWTHKPLQIALDTGLISEDEKREVVSLLVFFTVVSLVAPRTFRDMLLQGMAAIYGAQLTWLNFTDFAASLTTSTTAAPSGASQPV